jgi:tellurite resistance protein
MTALADGHLDSAESQALAEITVSLNQNITPTDVVEAIKLRLS